MNRTRMAAVAALALAAGVSAAAASPWMVEVASGLPFEVLFPTTVSTGELSKGGELQLVVARPLRLNGTVVVAEGAPVRARVREVVRPGILGRPGKLVVEMVSAEAVDGQSIPIRGAYKVQGEDRQWISLGIIFQGCCLGLLYRGEEVRIAEGTVVTVTTNAETQVRAGP